MLKTVRAISSVGLERCLDRAEVTGSNPVWLTNKKPDTEGCPAFFIEPSGSLLPAWFYEKRRSAAPAAYGFLFGYKGPVLVLLPKGKKSSRSLLPAWGREKSRSAAQLQAAVVWVQGPRIWFFCRQAKNPVGLY